MEYKDYQRNHVILPGRAEALDEFLNAVKGNEERHKLKYAPNSNSEDALTWSCFDVLRNLPHGKMLKALDEIMEDSFEDEEFSRSRFSFANEREVAIHTGKWYKTTSLPAPESTEADVSIETADKLIFVEAKLYSSISLPDAEKPYNQIARKLRVGLDAAHHENKEFWFLFLDIAPLEKFAPRSKPKAEAEDNSHDFYSKWKSAWWFDYYKNGRNGSRRPLMEILDGLEHPPVNEIAANMGWLTWASLFKTVLRAMI
jgi:hypothetical protein